MDKALEPGWDILAFFIGLAFLLIGIVIAAIVSFVIAAAIAHYRYNRFKLLAEEDFEQEAAMQGLDIPAEEVGQAFFDAGIEIPQGVKRNMGQVIGATLFGMEEVEEW